MFDRSVDFSGSQTVDDGITVPVGIDGAFYDFELVTVNGDITIGDSGQLCFGMYGASGNSIDILSGTVINNGELYMSNRNNALSFKGENFYNYNSFGIYTYSQNTVISFSSNFVNEGFMYIWNNDANTTFEGPESGIINNDVITLEIQPPTMPPLLGTGCTTFGFVDRITFDISVPFNQTIYIPP